MKSVILPAIVGLFAALSQAVALPAEIQARQMTAEVIFFGANPDANYTLLVPTDNSVVPIGKSTFQ